MDARVRIDLDKEMYECGSEVRGVVDIKMRSPLCIGRINLVLSKTTVVRIQGVGEEGGQAGFGVVEKACAGYRHEFEVYSNDDPLGEMSSGHHRFPFRFCLRRGDEGSLDIKGVYFDILCHIRNTYDLYAEVYVLGVHNPVYTSRKEVVVADAPTEPRQFHTTIDVVSPMCFLSKRYDINFELDKQLYHSGDRLVVCASTSGRKPRIKRMECFAYEILNACVDGREVVRTKYVGGGEAEHLDGGRVLRASVRIPSTTPSTVTGSDFGMRVVLFMSLELYRGTPVRVKKYLHVLRRAMSCPELDAIDVLEGEVYPERVFVVS